MKIRRQILKFLMLAFTVVSFGISAPQAFAQAPMCSVVFEKDLAPLNTDYTMSRVWGVNLPENLQSFISKEVYLNEHHTADERLNSLLDFSTGDIIVAPGHKILRVSSSPAQETAPTGEAKNLLLNAITDANGKVLFVDAWDGHHRMLATYEKGSRSLQDFKNAGFNVIILVNGHTPSPSALWDHVLPSAASDPTWNDRITFKSRDSVVISGRLSNYEMGSRTTMSQLALNEAHAKKTKIGIYFGKFDSAPVKHIKAAKKVQKELGLSKVILISKDPADLKTLKERLKTEDTLDLALFDTQYYLTNFERDVLIERVRQDIGSNDIHVIEAESK